MLTGGITCERQCCQPPFKESQTPLYTLKPCQTLRGPGLNELTEAPESFCCHWLIKLQPLLFPLRKASGREERREEKKPSQNKNILYKALEQFESLDNSGAALASWGRPRCEVVVILFLLCV